MTENTNKILDKSNENNSLSNIDALNRYLKEHITTRKSRAVPPLEKWHPSEVGDMDLLIKANGEWWHEGTKVTRQSLIDLFATILWKENDNDEPQYFLKTPVQKLRINVEDVPFYITDINIVNKDNLEWLEFITSTGDVIYLDNEHPIKMQSYKGEQRPYIEVRYGMQALISRNVFMHLTQIGTLSQKDGHTILTLQSGGKSYQLVADNTDN